MPKQKSNFSLIAGSKTFNLTAGQSPRGLRNGTLRPDVIVIDCYIIASKEKLEKFIKYLNEIRNSMQ